MVMVGMGDVLSGIFGVLFVQGLSKDIVIKYGVFIYVKVGDEVVCLYGECGMFVSDLFEFV